MRSSTQISNVRIVESLDTRYLIVMRERAAPPCNYSASKSSMSFEEFDFVLCTMDDAIVEQLDEESISLSNVVATGMQDNHPLKQVKFVDDFKKAKMRLIMGNNSKFRMCNINGQSIYLFSSRSLNGDSFASCFITYDPTGIYDAEPINESIQAVNG